MADHRNRLHDRLSSVSRISWVAVGLLVVQTMVRIWQTFPGAYIHDDFMFLKFAREQGLTWDYLVQPWNGHLQPIGFALTWVCAQFPGSYTAAATIAVAVQLLASVSVLLLLRELVGMQPSLVVALAAYLFTPLPAANVMWWASSSSRFRSSLRFAAGGVCHLRFIKTRRPIWLVASLLVMVVGLGFTEKAIVVPVFLFLIALHVRGGARQVVSQLWRLWPAWVAYAVLDLLYIWLYLHWVGTERVLPSTSVSTTLQLFFHQIWDVFAIGMFGGPWPSNFTNTTSFAYPSTALRLFVLQGVVVLAVLGWARRGPRSLVAWACILGVPVAQRRDHRPRSRSVRRTALRRHPLHHRRSSDGSGRHRGPAHPDDQAHPAGRRVDAAARDVGRGRRRPGDLQQRHAHAQPDGAGLSPRANADLCVQRPCFAGRQPEGRRL